MILSLNFEPIAPFISIYVSPSASPFLPCFVVKLISTISSEDWYETISLPKPPSSISAPLPPTRISLPTPPSI